MATMTSIRLTDSVQSLIDSRLDTIDRMLLGRLPRGERLEIVREVESQIFELLQEQTPGEPSREDVLAVLSRLDPPEAYLSEGPPEGTPQSRMPGTRLALHPVSTEQDMSRSKPALASAILGMVAIPLLLLTMPLTLTLANWVTAFFALVVWYSLTILALGASVTGIVLAVYARVRGHWAITGLVLGIVDLLGSFCLLVLGMFL